MDGIAAYIAASLQVRVEVVSNLVAEYRYSGVILLTNGGHRPITRVGDWSIYFYNKAPLEFDTINVSQPIATVADLQLKVTHLIGTLHCMQPTPEFKSIGPKETLKIPFTSAPFLSARTDVEPNWFVVGSDLQAHIIESTRGESLDFVGAFDSAAKWKRSSVDTYDPFSPSERYLHNYVVDLQKAPNLVIPTPLNMTTTSDKYVTLSADWAIVAEPNVQSEADWLSGRHCELSTDLSNAR